MKLKFALKKGVMKPAITPSISGDETRHPPINKLPKKKLAGAMAMDYSPKATQSALFGKVRTTVPPKKLLNQ